MSALGGPESLDIFRSCEKVSDKTVRKEALHFHLIKFSIFVTASVIVEYRTTPIDRGFDDIRREKRNLERAWKEARASQYQRNIKCVQVREGVFLTKWIIRPLPTLVYACCQPYCIA